MDIEPLKEKLGDETFAKLQTYVNDLTGQRDAARNESITGRKGTKEKLAKLEADQAALLEKLGLESFDDLESLPDMKGAADTAKQYDAKLKRLQREHDDAIKSRDEATGKYRDSLQRAAVAEAMGGHDFIARDIVETHLAKHLTWEGDDIFFKSADGKLIPVSDGVAGIARTRPELLKPTGTGGAGVRQSNAGGGGDLSGLTPVQRLDVLRGVKAG